jgi:DNA-binding CsgD family transcriptional regulator
VLSTLPNIVAEIGQPRFFEAVLDWITGALRVDVAEIFSYSAERGPAQMSFRQCVSSFAPVVTRPYAEIYQQDPLYHAFRDRLPPGLYNPQRLKSCYPRNRFYDAYYRDREFAELSVLVPHGRDRAAVIYLGWSKNRRAVDRQAISELEATEPVLRACVEKHMSLELRNSAGERVSSTGAASSSALSRCGLTTRELEVARRMLHGDNVKATAGRLQIAQGTVQIHRKSIYRKLNVRSLAEFYTFCGVIEPGG